MATKKAEETQSKNLVQKLSEITLNLGNVPKKGWNAFHKYKYVLESDIMEALRKELASKNIMIFPSLRTLRIDGEITTVEMEYELVDGDSFDSETGEYKDTAYICFGGQGSDKGDKGIYKAFTGSEKYALMKTFLISTGDDPESDESVDKRADAASVGAVAESSGEFTVAATYEGLKSAKSGAGKPYKFYSFTAHGKEKDLEVKMFANQYTEPELLGMMGLDGGPVEPPVECRLILIKEGQYYQIKQILPV